MLYHRLDWSCIPYAVCAFSIIILINLLSNWLIQQTIITFHQNGNYLRYVITSISSKDPRLQDQEVKPDYHTTEINIFKWVGQAEMLYQ